MPNTIDVKDASGATVTVKTLDLIATLFGVTGDINWVVPLGATGLLGLANGIGQLEYNLLLSLGGVEASPTANTVQDRLKAMATLLTSLDGKNPALGQALAAASVPVVLTAAQLASLTAPVLGAGSAIAGKVGIDQTTPGTTNAVSATNFPATADTNSGNKSAGTLRVVIATDQPALTNKLLVTPDANSAVNVAQVGGATIATGHGTASGAVRVEMPTDGTGRVALKDIGAGSYETVAASQTDQSMGATGATGDYLAGLLVIPATTSPGAVSIKDGAGSAITVFTGGALSVSNLVPFFVPLGAISVAGAWKVTTGTNVSAVGVGAFT